MIVKKVYLAELFKTSGRLLLSAKGNDKGIALVTALMLTLISLTMIIMLMNMITKGVQVSGFNKRYRSVLQATYGASESVTNEMLKRVFDGYSSPTLLKNFYAASIPSLQVSDCFTKKINNSTAKWPAGCEGYPDAKRQSDMEFVLQSTTANPYNIYVKVVDTYATGNTEKAGVSTLREAHNVTEGGGGGGVTLPNTYRIEIEGERTNNPLEKGKLSVLYAY